MLNLQELPVYDVVACMWEFFRYLESYKEVATTLNNINNCLKKGGLFVVDFHHFPPKNDWTDIKSNPIKVNDKTIQETTSFKTHNEFDLRKDIFRVDSTIQEVKRSPLLRISEDMMREFLKNAGFKVVHFEKGFQGPKESMLFIAKKF